MIIAVFAFFSIFIAILAWIIARKFTRASITRLSEKLRQDYFLGIHHLINEQPDKAVDVFVKLLEVDSDTIETHLALGSLFRRRGEVERAIRIHQNLIARPQLSKHHRVQALSELGQDYLTAGILGRAEILFTELIAIDEKNIASLRYLLHIYQQEKDWEKAIEVARKLEKVSAESMSAIIAQYYAELALQVYQKGKINTARQYLKRAQTIHFPCVRTNLLLGHIEMELGHLKAAISHYKQVPKQDPAYISETVEPLVHCYQQLDNEKEMVLYFKECLLSYPCVSVILALADHLQRNYGDKPAIEFLTQQISKSPSLRGLNRLVAIYLENSPAEIKPKLLILKEVIESLLKRTPLYSCIQCGFSTRIIHWLCPSCFSWSTVKPIHGLEAN
jgi:lipopolysaccharide biosynthesis regulator YciM